MINLIEKIGELLMPTDTRGLELHELKVYFVKRRSDILNQLRLCKKSHGIIGIYATRLGKGMFLGTVTSIFHDVITLKPIEDTDFSSKTIMLPISEITSVCPFNQLYVPEDEYSDDVHESALAHAN